MPPRKRLGQRTGRADDIERKLKVEIPLSNIMSIICTCAYGLRTADAAEQRLGQ